MTLRAAVSARGARLAVTNGQRGGAMTRGSGFVPGVEGCTTCRGSR